VRAWLACWLGWLGLAWLGLAWLAGWLGWLGWLAWLGLACLLAGLLAWLAGLLAGWLAVLFAPLPHLFLFSHAFPKTRMKRGVWSLSSHSYPCLAF